MNPTNEVRLKLSQIVSLPGTVLLLTAFTVCLIAWGSESAVFFGCSALIGVLAATLGVLARRGAFFQFSIRGLMVLMAIIAVLALLQQHWLLDSDVAIERIEQLGGDAVTQLGANGRHESNASLTRLQLLPRHLNYLRSLPNLTRVDLDYSQIGNRGMRYVGLLRQLQFLDLEDTSISDDGLKSLEHLQQLERIILDGNAITDAGLMHLSKLKSLSSVRVRGTQVTAEGAARLEQAIPGCEVNGFDEQAEEAR